MTVESVLKIEKKIKREECNAIVKYKDSNKKKSVRIFDEIL